MDSWWRTRRKRRMFLCGVDTGLAFQANCLSFLRMNFSGDINWQLIRYKNWIVLKNHWPLPKFLRSPLLLPLRLQLQFHRLHHPLVVPLYLFRLIRRSLHKSRKLNLIWKVNLIVCMHLANTKIIKFSCNLKKNSYPSNPVFYYPNSKISKVTYL